MSEVNDEGHLRKYLLGGLSETEQQALEERLMTESELFALLPVVEDELIEDYLGELLSSDERGKFESFFVSTPERRRRLSFVMALRRYITTEGAVEAPAAEPSPLVLPSSSPLIPHPSAPWRQALSSTYLRMAAAAVIVLVVGLGTWRTYLHFRQSQASEGMVALREAYPDKRPTQARITDWNYAPPPTTTRGEKEKSDYVALDGARALILLEVREHPGVKSYHDLGRLYLAEREFDKAREQLEKALELDDKDARIQNDLGAALLEMGKVDRSNDELGKSVEEFALSLEHLSKAIEMDDSLIEALFNRAILYEEMFLPRQAEEDWRSYLKNDPGSQWANEAKEHLRVLEEQKQRTKQSKEQVYQNLLAAYLVGDNETAWKIISGAREFSGNFIENRLLDDYLDLTLNGRNEKASAPIELLFYVADLELRRAGDHYLSDLVSFYKLTSTARKQVLAQARGLMKLGHENLNRLDPEEALRLYERAEEIFVRAGDACEAAYIKYPMGHCYLLRRKDSLALSRFQKLAEVFEKRHYRWLLGQTLDAIANACTGLRDFSIAIKNSSRSLKLSEEIGDINGVLKTLGQMGAEYSSLNNHHKSLDLYSRRLNLAEKSASGGPLQRWRHYFTIAVALEQVDLPAASLDYQREALQIALEGQLPQLASRSYTHLGVLYANRYDYESAIRNIQIALDLSKSFSDRDAQMDYAAYAFLHLGNLYKQAADFDKALVNYDKAIQLYDELDSKYFNYISRKGKLLCCIAHGGCPSIEQEIEATLELFEKHRAKIQEESNRNSYFDAEQDIYDVAIDFAYSVKKDSGKAFEYSEACRARSLHDSISTDVSIIDDDRDNPDIRFESISQPLGIEEIRRRLPEDAEILQYAVLKDKVLIWVLSRERRYDAVKSIALKELNQKVRNYLRQISEASEAVSEEANVAAQDLYDLLIKPVELALDSNKTLCIVPDKILSLLPFGALISSSSKEYFIVEHDLLFSPSANIFVRCTEAARERNCRAKEALLSVGDPRFDKKAFAFDDLGSAATEAETIAGIYASRPITGRSATKMRITREMEKSDIIHLATHCIVDQLSPMRSKLLLAKDRKGGQTGNELDAVLYAYEIYALNLTRARLVVLSGCQTGVERYYGGEGMIGISRPFIAKKVPLVVASLWPVNSKSTAELMISLHKHRKSESGLSTTKALRLAQLEMLGSADPSHRLPYHWAAFVAIGGHANF
jgi:CHAT domain-containing protein